MNTFYYDCIGAGGGGGLGVGVAYVFVYVFVYVHVQACLGFIDSLVLILGHRGL